MPVWLLLAPRDYLSAFVKIGVVLALAAGILSRLAAAADAGADAVHRRHRAGVRRQAVPVRVHYDRVRRDLGFHALISSGTTPKMLETEDGRAHDRIRRDAHGVVRRRDGIDRRLRADTGRLLRDQRPAGAIGTTAASAAEAVRIGVHARPAR
jgi:carbon starvation protein